MKMKWNAILAGIKITVHGRSFMLQNIEDLDKYFDSPADEIRSRR
jgi:hypothetical protein